MPRDGGEQRSGGSSRKEKSSAPAPGKDEPLAVGQVLGQRWRLRRRVGKGTFSEIFEAADLQRERGADGRHPHVAVKIARDAHKCSMLQHEQEVLEGLQGVPNVARYIELGKDASCSYLVMTLLGENISELRRLTPTRRFSLRTTALLGLQLVEGIRRMHESGYVHRDIKPSNCCIGLLRDTDCFLCDFGLARRWKLANGDIRPRRDRVEFRGTCRCAHPPPGGRARRRFCLRAGLRVGGCGDGARGTGEVPGA